MIRSITRFILFLCFLIVIKGTTSNEVDNKKNDPRNLYSCNSGWVFSACCQGGGGGCGRSFANNADLKAAVDLFTSNETYKAILQHGKINCWDVSKITDMSGLFKDKTDFNRMLACWNVSKVTNFASIFENAITFNQPLKPWNPSSAQNMNRMFYNATAFNQQLCRYYWIIGKKPTNGVTDMLKMTSCATKTDPTEFHPVGGWTNIPVMPPFCQDCSQYSGSV